MLTPNGDIAQVDRKSFKIYLLVTLKTALLPLSHENESLFCNSSFTVSFSDTIILSLRPFCLNGFIHGARARGLS